MAGEFTYITEFTYVDLNTNTTPVVGSATLSSSASNRCIVVCYAAAENGSGSNTPLEAVSIGGVSMTKAAGTTSSDGSDEACAEIWYVLNDALSGSQNVVINPALNNSGVAIENTSLAVFEIHNINTGDPIGATATGTEQGSTNGGSASASITPESAASSVILALHGTHVASSAGTIKNTWPAGWAEQYDEHASAGSASEGVNGSAAVHITSSTSLLTVTPTSTGGTPDEAVLVLVEFKRGTPTPQDVNLTAFANSSSFGAEPVLVEVETAIVRPNSFTPNTAGRWFSSGSTAMVVGDVNDNSDSTGGYSQKEPA